MERRGEKLIQTKCNQHRDYDIQFLEINNENQNCYFSCKECIKNVYDKQCILQLDQIEDYQIFQDQKMQNHLKLCGQYEQIRQKFSVKIQEIKSNFDDFVLLFQQKCKQNEKFEHSIPSFPKNQIDNSSQQENVSERFNQDQNQNNILDDLLKDLKELKIQQDKKIDNLNNTCQVLAISFQENCLLLKKQKEQLDSRSAEIKNRENEINRLTLLNQEIRESEDSKKKQQGDEDEEKKKLIEEINVLKIKNQQMNERNFEDIRILNKLQMGIYDICAKPSKKFDIHHHPLKITKNALKNCNTCNAVSPLLLWDCSECNYSICLFCITNEQLSQHNSKLIEQISEVLSDISFKQAEKSQVQDQENEQNEKNNNLMNEKIFRHFHPHQLKLINSQQLENHHIFDCKICNKNDIENAWCCTQCKYNICQNCRKKFQKFPQHKHELMLKSPLERKYNAVCDFCDRQDLEYSWNCSECQYDLCQVCSQDTKIHLSLHPHKLKFTISNQRQQNFLATCHECEQSQLKLTWHCPECKYDVCEDCMKQHEQLYDN
ncbi:hypothetical protein ABPG74_019970 [Tetrahymena malaccensis]